MSFRKWVSPIHTYSAPLPDALPRAYLTDDQASPFPVETLVEEKKNTVRAATLLLSEHGPRINHLSGWEINSLRHFHCFLRSFLTIFGVCWLASLFGIGTCLRWFLLLLLLFCQFQEQFFPIKLAVERFLCMISFHPCTPCPNWPPSLGMESWASFITVRRPFLLPAKNHSAKIKTTKWHLMTNTVLWYWRNCLPSIAGPLPALMPKTKMMPTTFRGLSNGRRKQKTEHK